MFLSIVKQTLFPEEFTVDQKPFPVDLGHAPAPAEVDAVGGVELAERSLEEIFNDEAPAEPPSASAGDSPQRAEAQQDLLIQMRGLLLEQERLAERARMLEMKGNGSDEFGKFVKQMLPFMDNFAHLLDLAREHPPSEELNNWLKGVEALYFRIVNLLETYDLRFINSLGKVVNLDFHEVIDYRMTDQFPHNTVIKELQKGVVFRGHLIRDAKVVVACNPDGDPLF